METLHHNDDPALPGHRTYWADIEEFNKSNSTLLAFIVFGTVLVASLPFLLRTKKSKATNVTVTHHAEQDTLSIPPPLTRLEQVEESSAAPGSSSWSPVPNIPGASRYGLNQAYMLSPESEPWSRQLASPGFVSAEDSPASLQFQQAAASISQTVILSTPTCTPQAVALQKTTGSSMKSMLGSMLRRRKQEESGGSIWDNPERLAESQANVAFYESVDKMLASQAAREHISNSHGGRSPFAVVSEVGAKLKTFKDLRTQDADGFSRLVDVSNVQEFDTLEPSRGFVIFAYIWSQFLMIACFLWAEQFQGWARAVLPALWFASQVYSWQHGNSSIVARASSLYTVDICDEYQFPVDGVKLAFLEVLEALFSLLTLGFGGITSILFMLFFEHKQTVTMMLLRCVLVCEVKRPVEMGGELPEGEQEPPCTPGMSPRFTSRLPRAPRTASKLRK